MSTFDWISLIFREYWKGFLKGTGSTLVMALSGTLIGFMIGLLVAIVRTIPVSKNNGKIKFYIKKVIDFILNAYVEIIRGTPMMVQALIIHYGLFVSMGIQQLPSAIIIISFNTGAYMAEIVRGGIISVDKGQVEGAHAIGMNHWQTMIHVILPQAIRNIMPSIGNEFVVNIKDSSVLSVIAITELMFIAKQSGGAYTKYLPSISKFPSKHKKETCFSDNHLITSNPHPMPLSYSWKDHHFHLTALILCIQYNMSLILLCNQNIYLHD